jgi:glycosyltransferase involved in cell wall biosynthesis
MQDIARTHHGSSTGPLVSIITPFYNTEAYLSECIESVLRQTYQNWEYLLVNNCSTDRSKEIAERYAALHPERIRVENNISFLSQVANYNHALSLTSPQSKYCKMLQADDCLFPQCVELMVEAAERDSSVGVVGSYALEGRFVCFDGLPFPSPVVSGRDACRLFLIDNRYLFGSPTQLMLRSDLVLSRQPFYDESYYPFEDAIVIFEILRHRSFGFVHQVLTFSRRDNDSVMRSYLEVDCQKAFELLILHQVGSFFLESSEYDTQLKIKEREYAQLLIYGAVCLRGDRFWRFHLDMLKRMGYRLRSRRAMWMLFLSLCDAVLSPKNTLSQFVRAVRRTSRRGAA